MLLIRTPRPLPAWPTGLTLAAILGAFVAFSVKDAHAQATAPSRPQASKAAKPDDPKAKSLFDEVVKAYQSLTSYSDHGEFVQAVTINDEPKKIVTPISVTLVRPNKIEILQGPAQMISDGKTITTAVGGSLKKYAEETAPATITLDSFRRGPIGAILFQGPSGPTTFTVLSFLTSKSPAAEIKELGASIQPAVGSSDELAFVIDLPDAVDLWVTIDPKTKLMERVELKINTDELKKVLQPGVTIQRFAWSSGLVSTDVPTNRSFTFQPPEGFKKVDPSSADRPANPSQEPTRAVQKLIGKPAPDFTLTVLDGPGKTKTITKAELSGKVVVLDFWATWCPPCMKELPELQKVVEAYATSGKDVSIVAVSEDSEPDELSEVRKLVEKTLTNEKLDLTAKTVASVALDPSNSMMKLFDIEGLPTLVILDQKGIIRGAHVGFNPNAPVPFNKMLSKEINTLLEGEGKPLDPQGAQGKAPAAK